MNTFHQLGPSGVCVSVSLSFGFGFLGYGATVCIQQESWCLPCAGLLCDKRTHLKKYIISFSYQRIVDFLCFFYLGARVVVLFSFL